MALQGNYTDKFGVTHDQAYAKITYLNIDMLNVSADLMVNIWHDKTTRDNGNAPVEMMNYMFDSTEFNKLLSESTSVETLFVPIYDYLKTKDFAGWTDV